MKLDHLFMRSYLAGELLNDGTLPSYVPHLIGNLRNNLESSLDPNAKKLAEKLDSSRVVLGTISENGLKFDSYQVNPLDSTELIVNNKDSVSRDFDGLISYRAKLDKSIKGLAQVRDGVITQVNPSLAGTQSLKEWAALKHFEYQRQLDEIDSKLTSDEDVIGVMNSIAGK